MSKGIDRRMADKIFEKWMASLASRTRGKDSLYDNFNDLFFELSRGMIEHDVAYEYVKQAVSKHLPDRFIVNRTYKGSTASKHQTEGEFFESWKTLITDKAIQAFYDVYPLQSEAKTDDSGKIQLPRGMSKKEYVMQRQHAKSFPLLDLSAIEDMYKQVQDEKLVTFDDILGDFNGKATDRQD